MRQQIASLWDERRARARVETQKLEKGWGSTVVEVC